MFLIFSVQSKHTIEDCIDEDMNQLNHSGRFALLLEHVTVQGQLEFLPDSCAMWTLLCHWEGFDPKPLSVKPC